MMAHDLRRASITLMTMALLACPASIARAQPPELPAQIVTLGGRAELSRKASPAWTAAVLRDELSVGDGVRTAAGRLTLTTTSGQALRFGPRTQVFLVSGDASTPGRPTRVRMDGGRLWAAVMTSSPEDRQLAVQAGPATVTVLGGGVGIAMNPDGSVVVSVYHGRASIGGDGWQRVLIQDQELIVPATGAPKDVIAVKRDKRDADWIKWNEQQDSAGGYGARVER